MDRTRDGSKKQNFETSPRTRRRRQGFRKSKPCAKTFAKSRKSISHRSRTNDSRFLRTVERNEKISGRRDWWDWSCHRRVNYENHQSRVRPYGPYGPYGPNGPYGLSVSRDLSLWKLFFHEPSSIPSAIGSFGSFASFASFASPFNSESLATSSGIGVSFFRSRFVWYPFFSTPHFSPRLFSSPASNLRAKQSPVLLFHSSSKFSRSETFELLHPIFFSPSVPNRKGVDSVLEDDSFVVLRTQRFLVKRLGENLVLPRPNRVLGDVLDNSV